MSRTVKILYFLSDDYDSEKCPNVFTIKGVSPNNVTLALIRGSFPLPGVYHFSVKNCFNGQTVWEDLVDDSQVVPVDAGYVSLKISRIKLLSRISSPTRSISPKVVPCTSINVNSSKIEPKVASISSNDLLGFDENSSSDKASKKTMIQSSESFDLFESFTDKEESINNNKQGGYLDSLDLGKANLGVSTEVEKKRLNDHPSMSSPNSQDSWTRFMSDSKVSLQSLADDFKILT